MEIDWPEVVRRVQRLRDAGPAPIKTVHGASGHRFKFAPRLSEADLAEAEAQFGARLPEDYRSYLLHAGAGGAGPHYGLFPLAQGEDGRWAWVDMGEDQTDLDSLGTAFDPDGVKDELDRYDSEEPSRDDESAWNAWDDRFEELQYAQTRGAICLAHQGCGYWDWLVVSGPWRGSVWDDCRGVGVEMAQAVSGRSFGFWYMTWLERFEREAFGDGLTPLG